MMSFCILMKNLYKLMLPLLTALKQPSFGVTHIQLTLSRRIKVKKSQL